MTDGIGVLLCIFGMNYHTEKYVVFVKQKHKMESKTKHGVTENNRMSIISEFITVVKSNEAAH